jgi:hypothetical protein
MSLYYLHVTNSLEGVFMQMPTARLVSQKHHLRTGMIILNIEIIADTQDELITLSPNAIYHDKVLFEQFDAEDRERIAFWAGVEYIKQIESRLKETKFNFGLDKGICTF